MQATKLLDRIAECVRAAHDADRRANPDRFTDSTDGLGPDLMFVENVARILGCNVDFVRRIPRHELPASPVGRRLIYQRQDVEAYVRSQRHAGAAPMRAPHHRRATRCKLPAGAGVAFDPANNDNDFDPVAMVRGAMGGKGR